jgi:hypothetical protein
MKAMLIPELQQLVSLLPSVVLADGYPSSLRESQQLIVIFGIDAPKDKGMIYWINVCFKEGCT